MHAACAAAGVKEVMPAISEDTAELALLPSQPAAATACCCSAGMAMSRGARPLQVCPGPYSCLPPWHVAIKTWQDTLLGTINHHPSCRSRQICALFLSVALHDGQCKCFCIGDRGTTMSRVQAVPHQHRSFNSKSRTFVIEPVCDT